MFKARKTGKLGAYYWIALAIIILLGLALRVWLWEDQARASSIGLGDEDEYYRGAIHILLQGDYYDTGKWLRPPITSLYFAGAFALGGIDLPLALLFQSALSVLTIPLCATLVRNLFGSQRQAIAGAAAAAFFLPFAAYGSRILSESLFIIFLALSFLLLERAQARLRSGRAARNFLVTAGLAIGLSVLTRAFILYFLPLLLLWLWYEQRVLTKAFASFGWLFFGAVVVIAPWSVRNFAVYHQLVLVETEGGYSFLIGTEPGQNENALQTYWLKAYPNSALRQRAQYAAGIENVRKAPLQWINRMRDKIVGLWHLHLRNLANNGARGATLQQSSVGFAFASDVEYVALMLAAILGIATASRNKLFGPMLALPLYTTLVGMVTVTSVRIREPLMLVAIAYSVRVLADPSAAFLRLRRVARLRILFLAAAIGLFILLVYSHSLVDFLGGQFWLSMSKIGLGRPALERAIKTDGDNALPYLGLGNWLLDQGKTDDALKALMLANHYMPNHTEVQAKLIQILRRNGDASSALEALKPIADDGWDNPQWYEWAWSRVPFWSPGEADLGAPAIGVMRGVYQIETNDGDRYRWTLGRAAFRLSKPGAAGLLLRLKADQTRPARVFCNGELLGTIDVLPEWHVYQLAFSHATGLETLIELETNTTVKSVDEPYARGIAVSEVKLTDVQ